MDPFTIITGVIGTTAAALQIGKTTYDTITGIRDAPDSVKRVADDLQGLYRVLGTLERALDSQLKRVRPDSLPVHMIANIRELVENCVTVFKDIQNIVQRYMDTEGNALRSFRKGFKWDVGRKGEVETLQRALANNKATLELAISTLNFFNSSQTAEVVQSLQKDVRRLRRQVNMSVEYQQDSYMSRQPQQPNTTESDPTYSLPMRRFLARSESVVSSTSSSTRVNDAVFSDDHKELTSVKECTEMDVPAFVPPLGNQISSAELYGDAGKTEQQSVEAELKEIPSVPNPDNTERSRSTDFPQKGSTWRKLQNRLRESMSPSPRLRLSTFATALPAASSPPRLVEAVTFAESRAPTYVTGLTITPPNASPPPERVTDDSSGGPPVPLSAGLTKTLSTPIVPFHSLQSSRPPEVMAHRSMTTPISTLSADRPRNPYELSGYEILGDSPDAQVPAPPTDRDALLGRLRQPSENEEGPESAKTDPHSPCRSCKSPIGEGKHYRLKKSEVWHAHCFRCSSCGNNLSSTVDPPFLLKDDFLVCNSCSLNCQKCDGRVDNHGAKDDFSVSFDRHQALANAPGQLSCPGLFFCHDCLKSIKNLRYVRTRQGIYCLGCHPTTMSEGERRRREHEREKARPVPVLVG